MFKIRSPLILGLFKSPTTFATPETSPLISFKTPSRNGFNSSNLKSSNFKSRAIDGELEVKSTLPKALNDLVLSFLILAVTA